MKYTNGKKYDQQMDNPWVRFWYEMVERYLKMYLPKTGSVLDAGGGTGEFSIRVAKLNPNLKIINYDISKEMLETAQEKFNKLGLEKRIENKLGDIMDLPFKDNGFGDVGRARSERRNSSIGL